jgi:hypothetical protein
MINRLTLRPPSSVPGTYRPSKQPPGIPAMSLPHVRYYVTNGSETLAGLAETYYGNKQEAQRIFNANRAGGLREDRTTGFLRNLSEPLSAGLNLIIP